MHEICIIAAQKVNDSSQKQERFSFAVHMFPDGLCLPWDPLCLYFQPVQVVNAKESVHANTGFAVFPRSLWNILRDTRKAAVMRFR